MSFGMSGTLAKGLLAAGWTPAAAVTARIVVAALVLLVPGLVMLRGRWHLLRANAGFVVVYGLIVVAGTQFAYFSAVATLQVGVALLIEYTAPVLVIGWLWAALRAAAGSADRGRRCAGRRWAGARARPGLRSRPRPGRA